MRNTLLLAGTCCFFIWGLVAFRPSDTLSDDTSVLDLLIQLGDTVALRYQDVSTDPEIIERGREIIELGRTIGPNGRRSDFVSKFYNCTSCHNQVQEDPNLAKPNPDDRLEYAKENGLPFLQATTFHGILNRESWYNEDYYKKYGELVYAANHDVREAIQLCAQECAQGRAVEEWEVEAIMAYYRELAFRVSDIELTASERQTLERGLGDPAQSQELIDLLKSKYLTYSPATFSEAPADKQKGYDGLRGDAENGELVYTLGCQNCHKPQGVSDVILDKSRFTLKKLKDNLAKGNLYSIYQVIRYGTHPEPGHRPYMPHYTLERMSHQQVEDLRAFIEKGARR
ncbi:MAG: c-type cytochrome [Bacteroidota bacterium]